ncbi:MAG: hypothetical protein OXD47_03425 [Gammaproteobacteria bacterium]|nr:hypothetical protein [Gammaproteobacteria bacterium]MCY4211917.1 hypothetical protein [Gammaproteobacteria bacterium]MCY4282943.1 hypothetical protein [Gammaproteobacteria bacterium]MCY4337831.1 hypothetical protein [Gammaproteobacteria bacterium]
MTTALYRVLVDAGATEDKAIKASDELNDMGRRLERIDTKLNMLVVGVSILIALGVIDKVL